MASIFVKYQTNRKTYQTVIGDSTHGLNDL